MTTVLFLCTGNFYRSRFAEHLFNAHARRLGLPWVAESRGLATELGVRNVGPIAAVTLDGLAARGIVPEPPLRMPAQARDEDFVGARRIIALYEREHKPFLEQRFPVWATRVEYWHVPDIGELGAAEACQLMEQAVSDLLHELRGAV